MRRVAAGAAVVLLLAGCGSAEDPGDGGTTPSAPASAGSTTRAAAADLGGVCAALEDAVRLPAAGTVRYTARFHEPTGWATNAPICDLEPDGEYRDLATRAPTFGRAEFNYAVLTDAELQQLGYPEYAPEAAQKLLTLDQAEPLTDELPCVTGPCPDGIHGYQYNFRFETKVDDIAVIARFDYITTDVSGERQPEYRLQAIEAFTRAVETITAKI